MIPKDLVLEGERVRLEPLTPAHLHQLVAACNDDALWEFTFRANLFAQEETAKRLIADAIEDPHTVAFVVVDKATNTVIGSTRYFDIEEQHRKLEIGWTFIARSHWRTHVNTECKLLLLRYAFETWNAARVQLKAEAVNQRSRNAILRLGATHEGTFRNFRIKPDGTKRDTAFYSIIDDEWPAVRERLQRVNLIPTST